MASEDTGVTFASLIPLLIKIFEIAAPIVKDGIDKFKASNGREPTADEVMALLEGLKPPTDYGSE